MAADRRDKTILQRVSKGGLWHSKPLDYSKETQEILSEVMKEAKLTFAQQREMRDVLSGEDTSRHDPRKNFKGKNPYVGGNKTKYAPSVAKSNYGIRSKEAILKSGCYNVDKLPVTTAFDPPVREKEKLQNIMAFGKDTVTEKRDKETDEITEDCGPRLEDKFQQIVTEIEERKQFLAEMRDLGVEKKYSAIINNQIAEKLRELELLHQETKCNSKQPN